MAAFPDTACSFLADLSANNDRAWFEANRNRYEAEWLQPAIDFVNAQAGGMAALSPPHRAEARVNGTIRRLHRDTRFSKDKTPFDPRLHLIFWTGAHPNRSPAVHIVLHADRLGMGAGQFAMTAAELESYRSAISENADAREALAGICDDLEALGHALTPETLKRVPRGFEPEGRFETFLKRKGLVVTSSDTRSPLRG